MSYTNYLPWRQMVILPWCKLPELFALTGITVLRLCLFLPTHPQGGGKKISLQTYQTIIEYLEASVCGFAQICQIMVWHNMNKPGMNLTSMLSPSFMHCKFLQLERFPLLSSNVVCHYIQTIKLWFTLALPTIIKPQFGCSKCKP